MEEKIEREFFVSMTFYLKKRFDFCVGRCDLIFCWDNRSFFDFALKKAIEKAFGNHINFETTYYHIDALCEITRIEKININDN